jgi:acyl-CoA thioesterase-1
MRTLQRAAQLILLLALFGCSADAPETAAVPATSDALPTAATTILAFGDSLTEGLGVSEAETYPSVLEARLQADGFAVEVINGGISGETSSAALARVDWMLDTEPDIVIVESGGNDGLRGIDLELTEANLDEIVSRFDESGAVVIVAGLQIIQNLGQDYTTQFAAMYPTIAGRYDAILIPFILEGIAADPEFNQPDFVHPNPAGYEIMVEVIYPFVLEGLEASVCCP